LEQSRLEHRVAAPGPATLKVPHREANSALFYKRQNRRRKDFVGLPALSFAFAICTTYLILVVLFLSQLMLDRIRQYAQHLSQNTNTIYNKTKITGRHYS
jgi:hypothetical protein